MRDFRADRLAEFTDFHHPTPFHIAMAGLVNDEELERFLRLGSTGKWVVTKPEFDDILSEDCIWGRNSGVPVTTELAGL